MTSAMGSNMGGLLQTCNVDAASSCAMPGAGGVFGGQEILSTPLSNGKCCSRQSAPVAIPSSDTQHMDNQQPTCEVASCAILEAVSACLPRTLEIEPFDRSCTIDIVCEWCSSFGPLHCITSSNNGRLRVTITYVDSRDFQKAKREFSKLYPANVIECSSDEADHDLTGVVLAIRPRSIEGQASIDHVRSMLRVFGPIAWSCVVDPLPVSPPVPLTAFEFYSLEDARQAVSALSYGSQTSFCLAQLNKRGKIVPKATNCGTSCCFSTQLRAHAEPTVPSSFSTTSRTLPDESCFDSLSYTPASLSLRSGDPPSLTGPGTCSSSTASCRPSCGTQFTSSPAQALPKSADHAHHSSAQCTLQPTSNPTTHKQAEPPNMSLMLPDTEQAQEALLSILSSYHTSSPTTASTTSSSQPPTTGPPPSLSASSLAASSPDPQSDILTEFDPAEAAVGGTRARTTVMIRNIPCRWKAEDLLAVLSSVIGHSWDLLYMPCKNSDVAHAGYAFMNFRTPQDTLALYTAMHGRCWPNTRSSKVCEVRYARIQGRHLLTHLFSHEVPGSTAAAFRGYLAFPANGSVIVHGPSSSSSRSQKQSKKQGGRGARKSTAVRRTVCVPHPADTVAALPTSSAWLNQFGSVNGSAASGSSMPSSSEQQRIWPGMRQGAVTPHPAAQAHTSQQWHPRSLPHVMHDPESILDSEGQVPPMTMPTALHHPDSERSFQMQHMLNALLHSGWAPK